MIGHVFAQAALPFCCGNRHRFGGGIEQSRNAGDMLFGAFAGFALQLGGGPFDGRAARRQRKIADITPAVDRQSVCIYLFTACPEQTGKSRMIGSYGGIKILCERDPTLALLVRVRKMPIRF